ncbi:NUDIX domain-containing protein [Candidatus Micrarchaeota archaeon]|nr:NUDIX domain-containing protein [Candidatus Micrarchaeota archaeon]
MVENRTSIGVILFRETEGKRLYLLLHYAAGHWDFPKGGAETCEEEEETLRRELGEETGIRLVDLVPGFGESFAYFFREKGQLIRKTVFFYLGKTTQSEVKLSFEHIGSEWLEYRPAIERLTHKNAKQLLEKAEKFLGRV